MTEPSGKSATPGRVPHPIPHTPDVTSSQLSVDSVRRSVFVPLSTEEVRKLCLSGDKAMAAVMSQAQHLASPTTSGPASPRLVVTPADQISESVSIRLHDARRATSTTGRPSDQAVKLLDEGFVELDRLVHKIQASTGLSLKQIVQRWQPPGQRHLNFWNIYQKYFRARPQEELSRLDENNRAQISMETIRAAYRAFRRQEPNYKAILSLFWRIHEIDGSNTSLNGRCREFHKYVNTMKRLAESASRVNGFEIAFCAVGSVVQQDQSLSASFCSSMVSNFFQDRLRFSEDEVEAHLKAHAYDHASRRSVASRDSECLNVSTSAADQPITLISGVQRSEGAGKTRAPFRALKQRIMKLFEPCTIVEFQSSRLPFTDIPKILAQNGWTLENWPEDVPFPCDLPKGKGLATLTAAYRKKLLQAFDDPLYPLKVVKKYRHALPDSEPVIVGSPPDPDSRNTRGRRHFLNTKCTTDRNGPIRRDTQLISGNGLSTRRSTKRKATAEGHGVDDSNLKSRKKVGR